MLGWVHNRVHTTRTHTAHAFCWGRWPRSHGCLAALRPPCSMRRRSSSSSNGGEGCSTEACVKPTVLPPGPSSRPRHWRTIPALIEWARSHPPNPSHRPLGGDGRHQPDWCGRYRRRAQRGSSRRATSRSGMRLSSTGMRLSSRGKWLLDQGLGFCWNLRIFFSFL